MDSIKICDVIEYWDRRPCNVRHSNLPHGSKEYFDAVEARKYFVEPHIPKFADFAQWRGKRVLEIGCGIGTDTINFARAGAKVTAIDISKESINIASARAKVFGLENMIDFKIGNTEDLSQFIMPSTYDLIYSFGVLHHTPNPYKAVSQFKQFMDSKSELRIMLYAKNSWKNFMIEAGMDQPEAQNDCPIAYTYTNADVQSLLNEFEIINISQDHIFPYKIENYVKHEYKLEPWFEAMPKNIFKLLEKKIGWHMLIKARILISPTQ